MRSPPTHSEPMSQMKIVTESLSLKETQHFPTAFFKYFTT